ncbi:MAG: hypothetical protein DWQ02_28435 [Bacteroidetes bacterium]|nr:MAG: hypothetical protein DWQ02_28435 [Bacteroidota bacterium]
MLKKVISDLYIKYVKGTENGAIVADRKAFLCHLTSAVIKGVELETQKSYVSTRIIKHLYDKKPAEEFEFLVNNIHSIVKYPDMVYENKQGKRAGFCFVKKIKSEQYICCIEVVHTPSEEDTIPEAHVVTAYRIRKEDYLKGYRLLWSWKGDNPSS